VPGGSIVNGSSQLSVYAGRINATTLSLLASNQPVGAINATITFDAGTTIVSGTSDVVKARGLDRKRVRFNGITSPSDDLSNAPPQALTQIGASVTYTFARNSITLLKMKTQ